MPAKQASLFGEERLPTLKQWREDKDITESHHGGNPESVAAHKKVAPSKSETRRLIHLWALSRGEHGITADEAAEHFDCSHNHVAPRITELLADKLLVRTDERRKTRSGSSARVLVAKKGF